MQKFYDCGIDLGTTNSCIAVPDNETRYRIIENQADRMIVTPSAVSITRTGREIIGSRAYNSLKTEDLAIQFKRSMGSDRVISFESARVRRTPEELSALVLTEMLNDAKESLNLERIENVVITVPAAFRTLQTEATKRAAEKTEIKNVILLQEPIAAAVAYGIMPDSRDKYWMVFDYGGGTLDVAIISTEDNHLTVLNTEGNNYFGGSDIDRLICNKIILGKLQNEGYELSTLLDETTSEGRSFIRRIQLECERCKIALSSNLITTFELFDIYDEAENPIEFECEITREDLEELISDTVDESIDIARKALKGANITADQLDKILLVGGSTFIPLVRERLREEFHVPLDSSINPMTVVAAGAAIYASSSVIDVEEDPDIVIPNHACLNLIFDPISSQDEENVMCKIVNIRDVAVAKIRIVRATSKDFSGAEWTSGWISPADPDEGIFDFDVPLQPGKTNHFRVSACNRYGSGITVENPFFDIKHDANNLKVSAPPGTSTISIEYYDEEEGQNKLQPMVNKNAPLPAKGDLVKYKLSRDVDTTKGDSITIKIWEGENFTNPEANTPAGEIVLGSESISRFLPKGTVVHLSLSLDEDRVIHVSGSIPSIDLPILRNLRPEDETYSYSERMDEAQARIEKAEASLKRLKSRGEDVSELEQELSQLKYGYDGTYARIETDEKGVNDYLENVGNVETRIIQRERESHHARKASAPATQLAEARQQVEQWGDEADKKELERLEKVYYSLQAEDEKNNIAEQIKSLGLSAMINNFTWLSSFFLLILASPNATYTNQQKAEYWKAQGYQAVMDKDTKRLQEVIVALAQLDSSTPNQDLSSYIADLTK